MSTDRITLAASATVLGMGAFWGLYWIPVRAVAGMGLPGAWGTAAIALAAAALLAPLALPRRQALWSADPVTLGSVALGGAAFALYSVGLLYGRVAIITLLYFLTPVWSTLIGRYWMGWPTPPTRVLAIVAGLLGLGVMLGADGALPLPRGGGEWMALIAGVMWSLATTGMRVRPRLAPFESTFVFAASAALAALALAPFLEPLPAQLGTGGAGRAVAVAALTGGIWWALSVVCLLWATVRLEPARVGILLMSEVLVGAASAALLAGERLHPLEIAGGALVLVAGVLELWPVRRVAPADTG